MGNIDWNELIEGDSDEESYQRTSVVRQANGAVAESSLPPTYDHTDHETAIRTVIKYEWLPEDEVLPDGKNAKKVTYKYKVERKRILQSIARRKHLSKFGAAANDLPGPNPHTTSYKEEINIQYLRGNDAADFKPEERIIPKSVCSHCGLDHLSSKCPTQQNLQDLSTVGALSSNTAKYVPPSRRPGAATEIAGKSTVPLNRPDEPIIRVTNLPEEIREGDLKELFSRFGYITRAYLGRDRITGAAKGYAFITYDTLKSAQTAVASMNGYGYAHLVLGVEMAQSTRSNRP